MKVSVFMLITVFYFGSCSTPKANLTLAENNHLAVQIETVSGVNTNNQTSERQIVGINKTKNSKNFRVDSYEENKLFNRYFFRNDLLVKSIGYNTQTNRKESEIKYFYKKNGEYDRLEIVEGNQLKELIPEIEESVRDFYFQSQLLLSNNIEFPLFDIVGAEINDLAKILSTKDNYNDFKIETQIDGNQIVIKLIDFNKKIRFDHSAITFVTGNSLILIKDYELKLENNFPSKEIYKTDNGELTKTYSYKDGKLTNVIYQFTNSENQINTLTKRFEYHQLQ